MRGFSDAIGRLIPALTMAAGGCLGSVASAEEVAAETLYLNGTAEICGSEPRSCRHSACGRDSEFSVQKAHCAIPTPSSEASCTSTSPVPAIRRKLREISITPTDDIREVFISSQGGRCIWREEEVFLEISGLPDQDGFICVDEVTGAGCGGGLQRALEPTIFEYCEVSFEVYSKCPSAQACGSDFLTCSSIVFGLNTDAMLELSPEIPNERIFRNLLGAIFSNFSSGLLTAGQAHELSKDAEAAFNDVDKLYELLSLEQNRG